MKFMAKSVWFCLRHEFDAFLAVHALHFCVCYHTKMSSSCSLAFFEHHAIIARSCFCIRLCLELLKQKHWKNPADSWRMHTDRCCHRFLGRPWLQWPYSFYYHQARSTYKLTIGSWGERRELAMHHLSLAAIWTSPGLEWWAMRHHCPLG